MKIALSSIALFFVLTLFSLSTMAQSDNTNSPYTRYGYGQLADQSFASQRGMGGIGYGLRNPKMINPLNPASFSAVDSMTFMLDFGLKGQYGWFKDGQYGKAEKYNGGLEYLAMQFPLAKGLGMGIGLEPVSFVGYKYGKTITLPGQGVTAYESYDGSGGLSKVYTTLSYDLSNRLSIGVNVGYLFGDIIHNSSVAYSDVDAHITSTNDTLRSRGFVYEAGLQYHQPLGRNAELVIGAVYSPKIKISSKVMMGENFYDSNGQITGDPVYRATKDSVFQMPEMYGLGFTYRKFNKWTVGADFKYQRWADARFYDQTNRLQDQMRISAGTEYIPHFMSNSLWKRTAYRLGGYYTDSYIIDTNGSKYKEYGVSLGLGFPMTDRRSSLNMAFEYTRIDPQKELLSVSEQYLKFTISYTFNELWFFKRKLQ